MFRAQPDQLLLVILGEFLEPAHEMPVVAGNPVLVALRYQAGSRKRGNQMNVPSSATAPVKRRTKPISPFTHVGGELFTCNAMCRPFCRCRAARAPSSVATPSQPANPARASFQPV